MEEGDRITPPSFFNYDEVGLSEEREITQDNPPRVDQDNLYSAKPISRNNSNTA
tara:strand:+ start:822 stop:983 length:162 start_codon:yes stop_codon:yes gene_type:complete